MSQSQESCRSIAQARARERQAVGRLRDRSQPRSCASGGLTITMYPTKVNHHAPY